MAANGSPSTSSSSSIPVCPWCWITSRWVAEVQARARLRGRRGASSRSDHQRGHDRPTEMRQAPRSPATLRPAGADEVRLDHGNDAVGAVLHGARRRGSTSTSGATSCAGRHRRVHRRGAGAEADLDPARSPPRSTTSRTTPMLRAEADAGAVAHGPDVGTPILTFAPATRPRGQLLRARSSPRRRGARRRSAVGRRRDARHVRRRRAGARRARSTSHLTPGPTSIAQPPATRRHGAPTRLGIVECVRRHQHARMARRTSSAALPPHRPPQRVAARGHRRGARQDRRRAPRVRHHHRRSTSTTRSTGRSCSSTRSTARTATTRSSRCSTSTAGASRRRSAARCRPRRRRSSTSGPTR